MNRIDKMKQLRFEQKWTLDKIGVMFGVSRERVRQLIGNSGDIVGKADVSPRKAEDAQIKAAARDGDFSDLTTTQLAEKIGKSYQYATEMWQGVRHAVEIGTLVHRGFAIEDFVSKILSDNGIENSQTNSKPFDIVLSNGIKIEVKSRHKPEKHRTSKNFYFFPLARALKNNPDFFILVVVRSKKKNVFIIPSSEIADHGGVGFVFPPNKMSHNKWIDFENRFDLLK